LSLSIYKHVELPLLCPINQLGQDVHRSDCTTLNIISTPNNVEVHLNKKNLMKMNKFCNVYRPSLWHTARASFRNGKRRGGQKRA